MYLIDLPGPTRQHPLVKCKSGGTTYHEIIGEFRSWRDGALGDTTRSIHSIRALLEKAMEVETGALISQAVCDIDNNAVANRRLDSGTRPLSVDTNDRSFQQTIRVSLDPRDVPVVPNDVRHSQVQEQKGV